MEGIPIKRCTCGNYTPYEPKGICAPMQPLGSCLNCWGITLSSFIKEQTLMANGYWILVYSGWGSGLNMLEPFLLEDDQGNNWHVYHGEKPTREEIMKRHGLTDNDYFKVIW